MNYRLIGPDPIDCDSFQGEALSGLPEHYVGPCIVEIAGRTCETVGLPDVSNAESAAVFAVGPLGGYTTAIVRPGSAEQVTHGNWLEWAFDLGVPAWQRRNTLSAGK